MLDTAHTLAGGSSSAPDGHVTLTAEVPSGWDRSVTLAAPRAPALPRPPRYRVAHDSEASEESTTRGPETSGAGSATTPACRRPSVRLGLAAVREYYESVNVLKASEDKTFTGAIAAGLASPSGQSAPAGNLTNGEPTYFGSYREEFSRDMYEAFDRMWSPATS